MLEPPADNEIGSQLGSQLERIQDELENYSENCDYENVGTQTMSMTYNSNVNPVSFGATKHPSSGIAQYNNNIASSPTKTDIHHSDNITKAGMKIIETQNKLSSKRDISNQYEKDNRIRNESMGSSDHDRGNVTTQAIRQNVKRLNATNLNPRQAEPNMNQIILGSDEETLENLLEEKRKIEKFLLEINYLDKKDVQTSPVAIMDTPAVKTSNVSTQRPDDNDIFEEVIDTLEPKSVAQAQLNLLVEVLQTLKSNGILSHLNLTSEDLELIKEEMKKLMISKKKKEEDNKYLSTNRAIYTGGSSFKTSGQLNMGMKDPSLHYTNNSD